MCLAFEDVIASQLFQKCGTRNRARILDTGKISTTVGRDVCKALPGMYSYTGCDSVSAFVDKEKSSALKLLQAVRVFRKLLQNWVRSGISHQTNG